MALLLLPALLAWWFAEKTALKKWLIAAMIYGILGCLFFAAPFIHKAFNFPQYIIDKQNEFKVLSGGSQVAVKNLEPTLNSFIHFLPTAIDIGFLRPHIAEIKNKSYVPAVAENIVLWAFFLFWHTAIFL